MRRALLDHFFFGEGVGFRVSMIVVDGRRFASLTVIKRPSRASRPILFEEFFAGIMDQILQ